jgi:hypothetical protein
MGYEIYLNCLGSREAHWGILERATANGNLTGEYGYIRPINPSDTALYAWISVFTNGIEFPRACLQNDLSQSKMAPKRIKLRNVRASFS